MAFADSALSRRSFSKKSLAGLGLLGFWPANRLLTAQEIAASDRLTVAMIGAGGIANFHAANQLEPFFELRAVCDVDTSRAVTFEQKFSSGEATVCRDYRELLDRDDIDVFFVCTPDHWHAKITVDALRSGKDVYCEKPLTLTIDEGRLIQAVLNQTDRVLQVGTQQRSDPNFQTAVALARSGRLGAVKRITAAIGGGPSGGPFATSEPPSTLDWNQWLGQAPLVNYMPQRCHGNFRWWYEYSGGKMTDWGAHHVDIAHWAIDEGESEVALIDPIDIEHPVALNDGMPAVSDSYNTATRFGIRCQFKNGTELIIRDAAPDLGFENGLLFECEQGRFFVNRQRLSGKPIEQLVDNPLPDDLMPGLRKGREVMNHVESFYWCCRNRTAPISDAASHLRTLNTCHLSGIAMRLGRSLKWDCVKQVVNDDEQANRWLARSQRPGFEVA